MPAPQIRVLDFGALKIRLCISTFLKRVATPRYFAKQLYSRYTQSKNHVDVETFAGSITVAPPEGGRGKLPPYGWTSKNYVICACTAVNVSASGGLRTLDPL